MSNRELVTEQADLYQIVPIGQFGIEHKGRKIIQVIDREAVELMAKNSGKVLLDYEHHSWSPTGSTEAAGWITDWEAREDGLYGRIEWSDAGQTAVNGRRFRYLSPTFLVPEMQSLGGSRYRPTRVVDAGLTNRPNMAITPLTNKESLTTKESTMDESIMALLGLKADASQDAITEAVTNASALIEKGRKLDATLAEVEALKNAAKQAAVDAVLNSHSGVLTDDTRGHYAAVCNHDLELGKKLLADLVAAKAKPGDDIITNRKPMTPPAGPDTTGKTKQQQIDALVNARKSQGQSFEVAFNAVRHERPELFA